MSEENDQNKAASGKSSTEPHYSANVRQLAEAFGLTKVRIQQLAAEGIIPKHDHGKYDFLECVKSYCAYIKTHKRNQYDSNSESSGDIEAERLRKTKEEADKLELHNARTRGELVEIAAVKKLGERVMIAIRSKILNFPITDDEKDALLRELMTINKIDWTAASNE